MPKLLRMRLSSIGYDSARFDDVTLDFTDRQGRPTNSIVWLRNGGGKTSLLSLLFAGLRTNKRDFLGQRAEEKVRRLSDYVGPNDHGVVVCEWELDAEKGLFDDSAPRYLSGVFYQRKQADGASADTDVDRLFFATLVSTKVPELSLEGLPLFVEEHGQRRRRTLNGFRRHLRHLDQHHPDHGVFIEDKNQGRFEEELASRGIDPEVFFYQVRMNEREGGVSERFSFAEDEEFIDFLLEMTFDQQHAQQVREQLSTFRQEIVERNEQLRPELECCRGLISRLQKLAGIFGERVNVFRDSAAANAKLVGLLDWSIQRIKEFRSTVDRLKISIHESQSAADESQGASDTSNRLGAVHQRAAIQIRRADAQAEYDAGDREFRKAKRQKEIWQAAVPLSRVWNARNEAAHLRKQLERKLKEFAPELESVRCSATRFANALEHTADLARQEAETFRATANQLREKAEIARDDAATAGEAAAKDEQRSKSLEESVEKANKEEKLLREQGILTSDDAIVSDALSRTAREQEETELFIAETVRMQDDARRQQAEVRLTREQAELTRSSIASELAALKETGKHASLRRKALEVDVALLRLLQTDEVDVEVACNGALTKAAEELRRVVEEILRIQVEAAEDERAIHALEESNLLPPSQDVQSIVAWLRSHGVRCWSGWEYIGSNVAVQGQRLLIQRLPQIATGIVVLNADYDRVVELVRSPIEENRVPRLRIPLVIAPISTLEDGEELLCLVVGPTSDAHFDKAAGAHELNLLLSGKTDRQKIIDEHQQWQDALTGLKLNLQQFHSDYPRGWFSDYRQKQEILESRLDEANKLNSRLNSELQGLQCEIDRASEQLQTLRSQSAEKLRHRDRLEQFIRGFGTYLEGWKQEFVLCRDRAAKSRQHRDDLRRQANDADTKSREASEQAQAVLLLASQFDAERSRIKHVDESQRRAEAGTVELLRSDYELLLTDYEGKVNADALSQMANDRDREAEKEEREFRRVLNKLGDVTAEAVEHELKELPAGITAQQHFEAGDLAQEEAVRKMGRLKIRLNAVEEEFSKADEECVRLSASGPLPNIGIVASVEMHTAEAIRAWKERDEHGALSADYCQEVSELSLKLVAANHEIEKTEKDRSRLESLRSHNQPQIERLNAEADKYKQHAAATPLAISDNADLVRRTDELETLLNVVRTRHDTLDRQRDEMVKDVSAWSRLDRFGKLHSSISFRFVDRSATVLETNAEFDILQLDDRIFQIETKLQEADQHRDTVIHVLATAVDEALNLLNRISRLSRLPERLPQAGQQFVKIETKASDNPAERRTHIGEFIDELLEHGEVGDGLQLVQKAVRRVGRRITVRVLHPDLHHKTERVSMSDMRKFSGGERLTMAILLYCTLMRLRQGDANRRRSSSVLILDNPIGTASRLSFLDMQREVARAMNVQLIYATAVKDLNAVGALENIIRLRNTRVDRRTGRHFIELDAGVNGQSQQIGAARIAFDVAPSSQSHSNGNIEKGNSNPAMSEVADDA